MANSYDVMDFGARGDGATRASCSITAGSTTLTCAAGNFTNADAGKQILVTAPSNAATGTVAATAGTKTLVGIGTSFTTELSLDQVITIQSGGALTDHVVVAITDDTHIDVRPAPGVTGSGLSLYRTLTRLCTAIASVGSATSLTLGAAAAITSTSAVIQYGTDDRAAIQAALDAAGAAGGGVVIVPAGTFVLGAKITIPSHVTLSGVHRSASILRGAPSWVHVGGEGMVEMRGAVRAGLRDLTLDGAAGGRTSGGNTIDHTMVCAAVRQCTIERARFVEAGIAAGSGTPSGPVLLLLAKDLGTDLGGQFGAVAAQACAGNVVRDCEFVQSGSVRIAKAIGLLSDFGLIPPAAPDYTFDSTDPQTTVSGPVAVGATVIPVTSASEFAVGDPVRIERIADPSLYDHASVTANSGGSITLDAAVTRSYAAGDKFGRSKGGYSPSFGGKNKLSLRSRAVDAAGDAFVHHVEGNLIEGCTFTGLFALFAVALQGGGTRHNQVRGCRFDAVVGLFAVLVDKGAYGNLVGDCTSVGQTRDATILRTSTMGVFTCNSHPSYYDVDNTFERCQVLDATGAIVYDCGFAIGPYSVRPTFRGCTAIRPVVPGNLGTGFVIGVGNVDARIVACTVQQAYRGIFTNIGGPPLVTGSGGLIEACIVDVVEHGILLSVSGGQHGGTSIISRNRIRQSAVCLYGALTVQSSIQAAQVHDNTIENTGTPQSGHVAMVFNPLTGSADGNHVKTAHTAYEIGPSFAGHWGERNHAESATLAIRVVSGASFPVPAGAGLSFTDTQHGSRGGGALHALASGAAAGFMPAAHYSEVANATPNNCALTLVKRDAGGNFSAQAVTMASASVTGAATFTGLTTHNAGATMAPGQHVTVSGTGRFKHGPMELPLPAAAFRPTDGSSGSVPVLSTGEWIFSPPPGDKIAAPVLLPVGARILSIVWSFNKGGSSSALSMMLKRRTGSAITIVSTTSDSSSGSTWTTATASSINYTMESGYQVWLEVACGSTMHRFAWANIVYDE
ncbi:glycosyl hydrolase family 28-related protein [Sorangium sp. So ce542]|uniref:glycosyl hydrolase family 28-related protein n=1 Tax=Sorangium sp. So ce542 TaxID=3133316 RepID=UPI003F60FD8A